jgi:predicted neuraminidase
MTQQQSISTGSGHIETICGVRIRKRRTRMFIIFTAFVILAYFDPLLKREVGENPNNKLSPKETSSTNGDIIEADNTSDAAQLSSTSKSKSTADAIISSNYIFPIGMFPSSHSATICALDNGNLLASWFAGTEENAPDVAIYTSIYDSKKNSWQKNPNVAVNAFEPNENACAISKGGDGCKMQYESLWNPVLVNKGNNELALFYKTGKHPSVWEGYVKRLRNTGKIWDEQSTTKLPFNVIGPAKNKVLVEEGGLWLVPSSREANSKDGSRNWKLIIERSHDYGETWDARENVEIPFDGNAIQPSIWRGDDGFLRIVARTATDYDDKGRRADQIKIKKQTFIRGKKYIIYSKSLDLEGIRWMKAKPTSLPGPNSGIDCVKLKDGRVVIIYNHSWGLKSLGRGKLNVAISHDDGLTWKQSITIENFDDGRLSDKNIDKNKKQKPIEMSYPAVIQDSKTELIHVVYTYDRQSIKHVAIDPSKL